MVAMLQRPDGASLEEIMAVTGWQRHTVRGAIAGAIRSRLGLAVTTLTIGDRRAYRIAA